MLFSFERLLAFSLGEGLGAVCGSCTPPSALVFGVPGKALSRASFTLCKWGV